MGNRREDYKLWVGVESLVVRLHYGIFFNVNIVSQMKTRLPEHLHFLNKRCAIECRISLISLATVDSLEMIGE